MTTHPYTSHKMPLAMGWTQFDYNIEEEQRAKANDYNVIWAAKFWAEELERRGL